MCEHQNLLLWTIQWAIVDYLIYNIQCPNKLCSQLVLVISCFFFYIKEQYFIFHCIKFCTWVIREVIQIIVRIFRMISEFCWYYTWWTNKRQEKPKEITSWLSQRYATVNVRIEATDSKYEIRNSATNKPNDSSPNQNWTI